MCNARLFKIYTVKACQHTVVVLPPCCFAAFSRPPTAAGCHRDGEGASRCVLQFADNNNSSGDRRIVTVINEEWSRAGS